MREGWTDTERGKGREKKRTAKKQHLKKAV